MKHRTIARYSNSLIPWS